MTNKQWLKLARVFTDSEDFINGVVSATHAGFGGSGYSVEIFDSGDWRVLWDGQIGNLYTHPNSIIISLPTVDDENVNDFPDDWATFTVDGTWDTQELKEEFLRDVAEAV